MSDPAKEQSLEEKILAQIEDTEKQYAENEDEIQRLKVMLNQRMSKRLELKGQHKALKRLLPKEEGEELSEKQEEK